MKKLLFAILFCISAFLSFSQDIQFTSGREKHEGKPQLFAGTSQRNSTSSAFVEDIINFQLKQQVEISVTSGFKFKGTVSSVSSDAPGLTTVTIQSSETKGLLLSVSRLILADKTVLYRGIITSTKHSDMLMLEQDPVTGLYNWNKKQVSHMLSD